MNAQNWYKDSRLAIQRVYGENWRLFAKCLAATSAHSSLSANMTLARKAYNQIITTGTVTRQGYIKSHYESLCQVIAGNLPNGRKCRNFALALLGDESCVVIDIWMMRYYKLPGNPPKPSDYDLIEQTITAEAKALGITPASHQATLWANTRGNASSYANYLAQYRLF